ncbi:MAG TPA: hypothetical protein PLP27_06735 [Crocinitomicaceae bacterium]|nr:hypothetical protein [Crocinitomicaceae bacterium]
MKDRFNKMTLIKSKNKTEMKIYCTKINWLLLWIVFIGILPYFLFPSGYVFFTIINLCSLYFLINGLKVYIFDEKGFNLKYRFFKRSIIYVNYEELDRVIFYHVVIDPHSNHRVSFRTKNKLKKILPNIETSNWADAEELISYLKDKNVELILQHRGNGDGEVIR